MVNTKLHYEPVGDFFQQDDEVDEKDKHESKGVKTGQKAFGLKDSEAVDRWQKILDILEKEPETPSKGKPCTKLFFIGRHGEGVHNIAEDKYGHEKWKKEMCSKTGDGEMDWFDAPLTEEGIREAKEIGRVWHLGLKAAPPIPMPEVFYCSPLLRPSQTLHYTFIDSGLMPKEQKVHVREGLREQLDTEQAQKRRPLSELQKDFPGWVLEEGASEEDALWTAEKMESDEEMAERAGQVLDEIYTKPEKCISITCHSNLIRGILQYTHHPVFMAPRGAAFAVLLKGTVKE